MKRVPAVLIGIALVIASTKADTRRIEPSAYLEHVKFLASDTLEGRGNGGQGLEAAADYIARHFAQAGLDAAGDNGTFFQRFEMTTGLSIEPGNAVTFNAGRSSQALEIGRDYELVSLSRDQAGTPEPLPIVFAG